MLFDRLGLETRYVLGGHKAVKITGFLAVFLLALAGCAGMETVEDTGGVADRRTDAELQMVRNPVSCLVISVFESVMNDNLPAFRGNYRWAGPEAAEDFVRFRRIMLLSPMPFTMRMDPPVYEITGRGEADVRRQRASLGCNQANESYGNGFMAREVRGINLESVDDRCRMELFYDGRTYKIVKVVWALEKM